MANLTLNPEYFAALGRDYLIDLTFVPRATRDVWAQYGTPAAWIAKRLCIEHPDEMTKLRQKLEAKPPMRETAPTAPTFEELQQRLSELESGRRPAKRELSTEQSRELDVRFGIGNDRLGTSYDARTCTQTFGMVR